jgi:imidazolonepropionase-like amidohydrolase
MLCSAISSQSFTTAFIGGRVIGGACAPAIERGVVMVRGGRIADAGPVDRVRAPAGAARIETAGKTVTPRIVNAHGHAGESRGLRARPEFYSGENVLRRLALYAR